MNGKNKFKCNSCFYQWIERRGGSKKDYLKAYWRWIIDRRTISQICTDLDVSYPKLIKEFDALDEISDGLQEDALEDRFQQINLIIDATFFGRNYGFLILRDIRRVLYFKEIKTESIKHFRDGLIAVRDAGYRIQSVTIDGRRGYINNIRKLLGNIPIQMCLFHQKLIIRRYITDKPQSQCGKDLKELMRLLCKPEFHQEFIDRFDFLQTKYHGLLHQRNHLGHYKNNNLRAAFRSINTNMMYLFTYSDWKDLNIPSTINRLEGAFGHLKSDMKIHRGLSENRKKKAVRFYLKNFGKKNKKSTKNF